MGPGIESTDVVFLLSSEPTVKKDLSRHLILAISKDFKIYSVAL